MAVIDDVNQEAAAEAKLNRRRGCGCKLLGGCALSTLGLLILVGISLYSAVNWYRAGVEVEPARYPAPTLAPADQDALRQLEESLAEAQESVSDWEFQVRPAVLNAFVVDRLAEAQEQEGFDIRTAVAGAEVRFEGPSMTLRITVPAEEEGYLNVVLQGDPTIVDGEFQGRIESITLRGEEAPWMVHTALEAVMESPRTGSDELTTGRIARAIQGLRLLRREGDEIHVILSASHLPAPQ